MTLHEEHHEEAGDENEATGASGLDPAASMSLLTSMLTNPLDAGYEHYRAEHGPTPNRFVGRLGVFVVAVALGFGSVVASVSLRTPVGDVKADLKHQAAQRSAQVATLDDEVQSLGRAIDGYSRSGPTTQTDHALALATGSSAVSGPGITVTLTDRATPGKRSGAVRDQDLAMVVNAMWGAGAEAVSINGQRIGPTTFVRTAGSVILVNITPVSSPYVVSAIGDSNALSVALVRGNTGDYLSAAQSVTGMTVSTKVTPSLSMDALAPTAPQYAVIGLIIGIVLGILLDPTVPAWLAPFLPVAVVAGLDALFGAGRAWLEGRFADRVFVTSFFWNVVVACLLVFLGSQLGVGSAMTTAVVVVLGIRIFSNTASIRRLLLKA